MSKKDLGKKIKDARRIKGKALNIKYTQAMLADEMEISRSYLGDIEAGRKYPNYILLNKIATACGIPVNFFTQDEQKTESIKKSDDFFDVENLERIVARLIKIPVIGKIPAGVPIEAEENIVDYVEVPESEVSNGSYFYLQVTGDSMIGSRIYEGDRVLVKKQPDVESGEIAVVRVNSHEATLKRVKKADGQYILYPDNPNYDPLIIREEGAEIIGKVVKVEFSPTKSANYKKK